MSVSNTYFPIIKELREQFGGFITSMKAVRDSHNICYQWILGDRSLEPLLSELVNYLRIKGQQASLLLALRSWLPPDGGHGATDDAVVMMRETIYLEVRKLNSNGKGRKGKS